MCGLVGTASVTNLTAAEKKMFAQLLCIDTLRGPHSTGVIVVDKDDEVAVTKRAVDGWTFVETTWYDKAVKTAANTRILAGHNRWATQGAVNYENSHPFTHGPVTMMHNGTLTSQNTLDQAYKFGTDSECIAWNLSQVEPENAGDVIRKIDGAFALVWYDERDQSLNFIRNNERTLYLSVDNADKCTKLMWASEPYMIDMVVWRSAAKDYSLEVPSLLPSMVHHKLVANDKNTSYILTKQEYLEYVAPKMITYQSAKKQYSSTNVSDILDGIRTNTPPDGFPKIGDIIEVEVYNFRHYGKDSKGTHGCVEGLFISGVNEKGTVSYDCVQIHGISEKEYDEWEHIISCEVRSTDKEFTTVFGNYVSPEELRDLAARSQESSSVKKLELLPPVLETVSEGIEDIFSDLEDMHEIYHLEGPHGRLIDIKEFDKLTREGCCSCSCNLDTSNVIWSDNGPMCDECDEQWANGLISF